MNYINTPLGFRESDASMAINRGLKDRMAMIDNIVELIIFTPKGSFLADPDFGFEYWNHEYVNIDYRSFNNGQTISSSSTPHHEITKLECQDSIRSSLASYVPQLINVNINMELNASYDGGNENVKSKHSARIVVEGAIENELGTLAPYRKEVVFFMEPAIKKRK